MCKRTTLTIVLITSLLLFYKIGLAQCGPDETLFSEVLEYENNTVDGPFTVSELESSHMIKNRETGLVKPFGYANESWERLKAQLREGDKIYFVIHRDPATVTKRGFYEDGHIVVRDGCVVFFLPGRIS